jgi:hypothetical protein
MILEGGPYACYEDYGIEVLGVNDGNPTPYVELDLPVSTKLVFGMQKETTAGALLRYSIRYLHKSFVKLVLRAD